MRRKQPPSFAPVVVALLSGKVFRGLGYDRGDRVVLTDVDQLGDGRDTQVRGRLDVPWQSIEFVQWLPVVTPLPARLEQATG